MSKIRGEYWIQNGQVDFADADVGDQGHEMVALNHVASNYLDDLFDYAEELGSDTDSIDRYDESAFGATSELLKAIRYALLERGVASVKVAEWVIKRLGINMEIYKMLWGSGDARLYVMKNDGWIAVRSNNIEMFGYDANKKIQLAQGLEEILDDEGIEESDEQIEFSVYDHKTKRSYDATLADIKNTNSFVRPQQLPNTTYNKPILVPADRSKISSKTMDAKTRNMVQTSESILGFREWLVRRDWPLLDSNKESPKSLSLRKDRSKKRR